MQEAQKELRKLAARAVKYKDELAESFLIKELFVSLAPHELSHYPSGIYAVTTASLELAVYYRCNGEITAEHKKIANPTKNASIADYLNRHGAKEIISNANPQHFEVVYCGDNPKIIVSIIADIEDKYIYEGSAGSTYWFKESEYRIDSHSKAEAEFFAKNTNGNIVDVSSKLKPYKGAQLSASKDQDDLTRSLSGMEIGDESGFKTDNPKKYFLDEVKSVLAKHQVSPEDALKFLSGVFAKSILGDLPKYSLRENYSFKPERDFAYGAFSVPHSDGLLFCQIRKLDGNLGHFGGFGRLDNFVKNAQGEVFPALPEQPSETVHREALKEIPVIGSMVASKPINPMFASVFTRKEPFPSEVAFGYERILSADDMNFIRSHIREVRVSRAKQKQLVAQTNDEVQSYLLIPFSIALYLQDNFQYPHEFEVFKEIAEKQKAKKLEIPEKTNLLLEEIQSYPHAKAWTIVAKRMALEAAYDAVLFKRNPEQEFTKSLDKYANAILSYLSPAKYDINGNLLSLYELERYLNKKFPMSLAKQLNFEEFKKKDALRDVISQYESTDILYAAFPQNELFEMYDLYRRALGFEDIKILTTETLSAHRTFLYQVEEEISKIVAITGLSEAERGSQILCHTDKIYPVTKPEYDKQIEQRTPEIERFIANELKDAVAKIFKGEDSNIGAVWAGLIKEQKDNIQKRIAEGLFSTEGEGKTEEQIVHDWISLRYRHFCHCNIGTKIVEDYFAVHKNEFPLLEIKPTKDAVTLGVFGGVGAGKTTETDRLLQEAGKDPSHYAMYDADALKRTLAVYAYREGVLTGDMDDPKSNWGVRVHRESSNANYEFALKLHEMAKAGTRPDLILNMMSLGAVEADMALEGGASLDAVFITIEIDSVWADVVRRAQKSSEDIQSFSNRLPPESIVRGSHVYANSAIVKSGNYAGKSLNLTFRERKGNNCNNVYAKWDVKNNVLEVSDWLAFSKMAQRAKQKDSYPASLTEFVKDFMLKGTLVVGLNSGKETVFSVNPAGEVVVADGKSAEFDEIKNINNTLFLALQSVKNKLIIGGKIITSASDALAR